MFKIKGFSLLCLLVLAFVHMPATAQHTDTTTCYGQGQQVLDTTIPCCEGLERMTEVNTHKIFCDRKPDPSARWLIWGMVLIFPFFLLVFLIFGIRNKMAQRQNKSTE